MCIVITRQKKAKSGAIFGKTKKLLNVSQTVDNCCIKKIKVVNC
jgi:hypothetical protein